MPKFSITHINQTTKHSFIGISQTVKYKFESEPIFTTTKLGIGEMVIGTSFIVS
jgi:hypothetical protein